jgi:hypothetical protein
MERQVCWGSQIGGIQALLNPISEADESSPLLSSDHQYRIEDFMKRHGGPSTIAVRQEHNDGGYRGWSEIYAADGYVLRMEWSRTELRHTVTISELSS